MLSYVCTGAYICVFARTFVYLCMRAYICVFVRTPSPGAAPSVSLRPRMEFCRVPNAALAAPPFNYFQPLDLTQRVSSYFWGFSFVFGALETLFDLRAFGSSYDYLEVD